MRTSSKLYVGIAAWAMSFYAQAYPGESIVRDPATGNYTITYRGDANSTELSQTTFVPSTKIDPTIRSSFRLHDGGVVAYRYAVSNGASAKQAIVTIMLDEIVNPIMGELPFPRDPNATQAADDAYNAATRAALSSPAAWDSDITRNPSAKLSRIAWSAHDLNTNGIQAGRTLARFGFSSLDLPGLGPSQMDGLGEVLGFPDEGPLEDSAVLAELERLRDNDFIARNAAVPTIAVPVPFDAAVLLERIRTHMLTWTGKQLVDPVFATQLDRYMVAAADAYRGNQPKAGKEHIETLREMLKREHKNIDHDDEGNDDPDERNAVTGFTIDRLAARVLDFDLRYVLKRTSKERD